MVYTFELLSFYRTVFCATIDNVEHWFQTTKKSRNSESIRVCKVARRENTGCFWRELPRGNSCQKHPNWFHRYTPRLSVSSVTYLTNMEWLVHGALPTYRLLGFWIWNLVLRLRVRYPCGWLAKQSTFNDAMYVILWVPPTSFWHFHQECSVVRKPLCGTVDRISMWRDSRPFAFCRNVAWYIDNRVKLWIACHWAVDYEMGVNTEVLWWGVGRRLYPIPSDCRSTPDLHTLILSTRNDFNRMVNLLLGLQVGISVSLRHLSGVWSWLLCCPTVVYWPMPKFPISAWRAIRNRFIQPSTFNTINMYIDRS